MSPVELGSENESAGDEQQQLLMTNTSSIKRGYYIRTMTASVQLKKKHWS
jgi:hypothetical protein